MKAQKIRLDSVNKIYDDGNHNAFTDLCRFGDDFYLTFRSCPDGHQLSSRSSVVVLRSSDAKRWEAMHTFSVPQRDARDPHFLVFNNNLFVYTGTWLVTSDSTAVSDLNEHQGYCAWSTDGSVWQGPRYLVGTQSHYIWRAAAHGEHAYLCGRRKKLFAPPTDRDDSREQIEGALLRSPDGFHWEAVGLFEDTHGNETAFQFEEDGSVLAIARRMNNDDLPAQVCRSQPPYRSWTRVNLDRNVGGPMLERWGSRYLVAGRRYGADRAYTALYWLENDSLVEAAEVPSGGDNSYPGFVELSPEKGLFCWYSSHEGSGTSLPPSAIYVAELSLE